MNTSVKKILYVFEKYPNNYQNYISLFLNEIRKKNDVSVLVYNDSNIDADYNVTTSLIDRFIYKISSFVFKNVKKKDHSIFKIYDIIHIQHSFLFRKLKDYHKSPNQKIIITLRGGDTYVKPWLSEEWRNFYLNNSMVDVFVVMSENQKKYLQKWGVQENRISVIPVSFGIKNNCEPKYPNTGIMKIVSAFRMTWEKNIEGNLFFVKSLVENGVEVVYDIYGDGNDLGQVYYLVDKYNLSIYVNVWGSVENEIYKKKLINYDFLLQLSYSEALPATVIEAQSKGIPCIVSDTDGISEAIICNQTGFSENYRNIMPLIDKTVELWKDPNRYFEFSKKAINYANNNFSIENEMERYFRIYNEI